MAQTSQEDGTMNITLKDVLQAARGFAGLVHTEVDMGKEVGISFRTVMLASYLADKFLAELKRRVTELEQQLRLGTVPNRANAEQELRENLELMYMLENNCVPSLHRVVDAELQKK